MVAVALGVSQVPASAAAATRLVRLPLGSCLHAAAHGADPARVRFCGAVSSDERIDVETVTAGSVIGEAWRIYKSQFGTLFLAALLVSVISGLAVLLIGPIAGLVNLILSLFFVGAVVGLVRDIQDGRRDEGLGSLFRSVGPVFFPLLAVSILAGIGIAIGLVLLIVPGLILITIWAVIVPVCVLERPGVFASFGRSRDLVRGHGWPVFGALVLAWLISLGLAIVGAIIATPLDDPGRAVVSWILTALTMPLFALVCAVLYFRLRGADEPVPEPAAAPEGWSPPEPQT